MALTGLVRTNRHTNDSCIVWDFTGTVDKYRALMKNADTMPMKGVAICCPRLLMMMLRTSRVF
jgi:hypothetical protein